MRMPYAEAVKKAKTDKAKENFLVVHIDARLVFPHRDGVKLIEALANAERLGRYSGDNPPIGPLDEYCVQSRVMGPVEYQQHKIAQLMGVSLKDVQEAEAAAEAAEEPTT